MSAEQNAVLVLNYLQEAHPAAGRKFLVDLLSKADKEATDKYWDDKEWRDEVLVDSTTKQLADVPKKRLPPASKEECDQHAVYVLNFLKESHPYAARRLLLDLLAASEKAEDGNKWESESWKEMVLTIPVKKEIESKLKPKGKEAAAKVSVSPKGPVVKRGRPMVDSDSSDDEAPAAKKARVESTPVKKAVTPKLSAKKKPVDSDSSDDEAPARPSAAKKASPALKARAAPAKKIVDSDSSDDEVPVKKAAATPAKAAAKKVVDDSSSDDEPAKKPVSAQKKPVAAADSSDDDEPVRKSTVGNGARASTASNNNVPAPPANFKPRTSRVDVSAVKFHNDRLKDNTPGEEATSFLQNRKMMAVKGKDFNKHKQKNKSKLYAPPSGVDTSVRSFKFDNSDDDE